MRAGWICGRAGSWECQAGAGWLEEGHSTGDSLWKAAMTTSIHPQGWHRPGCPHPGLNQLQGAGIRDLAGLGEKLGSVAGIFPGCPAADVALSHHILPGKKSFFGSPTRQPGRALGWLLLDSLWESLSAHPSGQICGAGGHKPLVCRLELGEFHILHFPV